jgi:arylsulfatase A-like enzyme
LANVIVERPVTLRSIPATILDLLGLGSASPIPGRSLAPLWANADSEAPIDTLVSSVRMAIRQPEWYPASKGDLQSLVSDDWHYILNRGTDEEELYAFVEDPDEQADLIGTVAGRQSATQARASLDSIGWAARSPNR